MTQTKYISSRVFDAFVVLNSIDDYTIQVNAFRNALTEY